MWKCDNCNTQNDNKVNSCIRCGVPRPKRIKGTPGSGGIFGTNAPSSSRNSHKAAAIALPVDDNGSPIRNLVRQNSDCPDTNNTQMSDLSSGSGCGSRVGQPNSQYSDQTVYGSPFGRDYQAEQKELTEWEQFLDSIKPTNKGTPGYRAEKDLYNFVRKQYDDAKTHADKRKIIYDIQNPPSSSSDDDQELGAKQAIEEEEEEEEEEEKDTPAEVLEVKGQLNQIYKDLTEAEDKEEAKRLAKEHVEQTMSTFELALQDNKDINDEDILSIIDDSKIKTTCKSGSSECSNLSILTNLILELPEVKKKAGNKTVETAKRCKNVENIMDAILNTNPDTYKFTKTHETQKLRFDSERNTDSDLQFENVWGTIADVKTECCYICEGKLVDIPGMDISPEMEHKLPSIEFYTKVHNINEKYPDLLHKWKTYITSNAAQVKILYMHINCNGLRWYQQPDMFLTPQFNKLLNPFITPNSSDPNINKFIALLKVYLMEFAYSHHLCNQVKDNDNLNTSNLRTQFINKINACIDKSNRNEPLNQSRVRPHKVGPEKQYIQFNSKNHNIIGAHFNLINFYIEEYADLCNPGVKISRQMKLKIIMVQSIKATINYIIDRQNVQMQKKQGVVSGIAANQSYIPILDELDALKKTQDEYNAAAAGSSRRMTSFNEKYPLYDVVAYDNKLAEYKTELNELDSDLHKGLLKHLQTRFYIHRPAKMEAPSSSTGKSKSGFGGKKTRRTNLKSNRKTRNKRGVRRCNKTQRHRKTKKK